MTPTVRQVVPVLRSFDESKAKRFYRDFLGFTVDWEHRFEPRLPLYMQVSLGGCVLHLSEHHGDTCPGSTVRIEIDNVDAYRRALLAKADPFCRPDVQDQPWGRREMTVGDPFGNRLIFHSLAAAS